MPAIFRTASLRHEYKYLLDEATAARARSAIVPFCTPDPYARRSGGHYRVLSLYFDTPDRRLAYANRVEKLDRFKLRIRTYPDTPSAPVFYEEKRRINDVFDKRRGRAPARWRDPLRKVGDGALEGVGREDAAAIERFCTLAQAYGAEPVLLCRYERDAFLGPDGSGVRITFDRRIETQPRSTLDLAAEPGAWIPADAAVSVLSPRSYVVLELKFNWEVPTWLSDITRRLDLSRHAFSKYLRCLLAFESRPTLRSLPKARGLS